VGEDRFTVAVIPRTYEDTTLKHRRPGDALNLESDMIGKYVARLLEAHRPSGASDARLEQLLREGGWNA